MSKETIKNFYNNTGWTIEGENTRDAIINENLDRVAKEYVSRVRLRILENLDGGETLLDIGCGPIQYPEYVEYSKNFQLRVCVDLSEEALKLAQSKIGSHGKYLVGDYLHLDTQKEAPFDAATLINVLYHVEKDAQEVLVRKILGDLKPGGKLVVVYSNPRTLSAFLIRVLVWLKHLVRKVKNRERGDIFQNPIYFYRHPIVFWNLFKDQSEVSVKAWRTFSPALEKLLFHERYLGRQLLRNLYKIEIWQPWHKISEYQIIVLQKY